MTRTSLTQITGLAFLAVLPPIAHTQATVFDVEGLESQFHMGIGDVDGDGTSDFAVSLFGQLPLSSMVLATIVGFTPIQADGPSDTDGDGLSDFLETHKYLTDPDNPDSDGDGVADGDWLERREYAYTVRSVIQVMRPVTPEFLNDAYQDARVLDETELYVELEVIHYPLVDLRGVTAELAPEDVARWLEPGPTSNASPELGRSIRAAMKQSRGSVPDVTCSDGVAEAARWLLHRATHKERFTTHVTGVDADGRFFIPRELADYARIGSDRVGLSPEETWPREFEAAGMFRNEERGSCTSSAIYLSGCLRALGVPTRTVLCVPVIDANDEREWELLGRGIEHHLVRAQIEDALQGLRNGYSTHTFNEVYVDGRWHRLNYSELDTGVLNKGLFGLMTHVATFHDWADARIWETIGPRCSLSRDEKLLDVFGSHNPYSTIALRDGFGVHCQVENVAATIAIEAVYWTDSEALPKDVRSSVLQGGRLGLMAKVTATPMNELKSHLRRATRRVELSGEGVPTVQGAFNTRSFWGNPNGSFLHIQLDEQAWRNLVKGTTYRVFTEVNSDGPSWILDARIVR